MEAAALCTKIAEEGIVLLKNEEQTLPLEGKNLNVFGWASISPCYGGAGCRSLCGACFTMIGG